MLDRESNELAMSNGDEVLEVDLSKTKVSGADTTLFCSNLKDFLLRTLPLVISPESNCDGFARAFQNQSEQGHLDLCAHLGHYLVVEALAELLHFDDFANFHELTNHGHRTVRVVNARLPRLIFFGHHSRFINLFFRL